MTEYTVAENTPFLWFRSLISGEKCAACGNNDTRGLSLLCPDCTEKLKKAMNGICLCCGSTYYGCLCPAPGMREAGCEYLVKLAGYDPSDLSSPVNGIVLRLKGHKDRMLHTYLARYLSVPLKRLASARKLTPENCIITFVPRSKKKKRLTGVDQAYFLARALAKETGFPCEALLRRVHDGASQKTLGEKEREVNAAISYGIRKKIPDGVSVILADDLVTTGATVCECTRLLRSAGAAEVYGVCIARTVQKRKKIQNKDIT